MSQRCVGGHRWRCAIGSVRKIVDRHRSSGGAALDLAAREKPDAIVLDVAIDGVDGIEVLPLLHRVVPNARVVIFTGHDDEELRQEALAAGASAWVLKGGDLQRLLDALDGAEY